jgi:prepilin-type N-terminal cleavage/methylation domain-containing protein
LEKGLRAFTLVELMIVVVIITILITLTLSGIFLGQQQALETKTISNLRQCAIAIYSYAKNHDGSCPNNWSDLTAGSKPYLDNPEITKSGKGVTFNLDCAGRNIYQMSLNETLASDSLDENPSNQAVYGDGHVAMTGGT